MPTTPILGINQVTTSQSGKETTINDAVLALENATNAKIEVDYSASNSVLLSNTEATRNMIYVATGATEDSLLRFPNTINAVNFTRLFVVRNDSGFEITVKFNTGAGNTIIVPDGEARLISALDGLDMLESAEPGTPVTFLALGDTPSSYTGNGEKLLAVNVAENALEFVDAAVFPSYVGNAGQVLTVNGTEDGVEWTEVDPATDFLALTDTPVSYVGQASKLVAVNSGASALEFIDAPDAEAVEFIAAERWRIFVTGSSAHPEMGFGEIEFLDLDDIDLTGSGTESASNFDTGFEADQAFDGITLSGTGWRTETSYVGDVWIEYDFGTPVTVRRVRLSPITDAADYSPDEFQIQYHNGSTWVSLGTRTPTTWVSSTAQTFKVNGVPLSSVSDAPADGEDYVRRDNAWELMRPTETLIVAASDETTAITTGTGKVTFRMPYAFTLSAVRASVTTAPTGAALVIDINENTGGGPTSILSTNLTIDAGEKTSTTAATPAVISDTALADDAEITVDLDQVGSTIAGTGVKVYLIGRRT